MAAAGSDFGCLVVLVVDDHRLKRAQGRRMDGAREGWFARQGSGVGDVVHLVLQHPRGRAT